MKKRYQYIAQGGQIRWTKWFTYDSSYRPKYQLEKHPQLINEYKDG